MPKILFWDIETAKMRIEMYTYSLRQFSKYLPAEAIKHDIWMPCVAWKWKDEDYIASVSVLKDKERFEKDYKDDYLVVKTMYDLIEESDILVAHNGDNFDWKRFQTRCIFHGMPPPKKPLLVDTLKIARREFGFSSNKLSYLATFLGVDDKGQAPDWDGVARGDKEAIAYCEKYNRQDIRTLEGVYLKLLPYATSHPNLNAILTGTHHDVCPKCGHWDLERRGYRHTKAGKYQSYQCKTSSGGCGGWSHSKKNLQTGVNQR